MFTPLIVKVVSSEGTRRGGVVESKDGEEGESDGLLQSAVLALCKFMCISADCCSKHLQVRLLPQAVTRENDGAAATRAAVLVPFSHAFTWSVTVV